MLYWKTVCFLLYWVVWLISSRHVSGADLFVCASYIYNHYCDCKDQDYFLSGDKINDITCLSSENLTRLVPVLACQDRVLRILQVAQDFLHSDSNSVTCSSSFWVIFYSIGIWACLWHRSPRPSICLGAVQQRWRQVNLTVCCVLLILTYSTDFQTLNNSKDFATGEEILFGTTDGKIGLVHIGENSAATKWEINNDKKKGGMLLVT